MSHETTLLPDGVWPTMVTPFRDGAIDYPAMEALIEWYAARGVAGLFAVCQSSEMFFLSLRERLDLAQACVRFARGRFPVIASGHVASDLMDQVEEAKAMVDTGITALVLISNRFARSDEDDDVFTRNLESFLGRIGSSIPLGLYECPYPYKRLLSPGLMRLCAGSGRFGFLKDTSCSIADIREKLVIASGTPFKLFNANAATLLESLKAGAAGYSGVMANFHPQLYARLCAVWREVPSQAADLQDFLGLASVVEYQNYPTNAKYALASENLPISLELRKPDGRPMTESMRREIDHLMHLSARLSARSITN